jgi:fatty acid desaturase
MLPLQSSRSQRENGQADFAAYAATLPQAAANGRQSSAAQNLTLFLLLAAFVFLAAAFVTLWSATLFHATLPSLHGRWRTTLLRGAGTRPSLHGWRRATLLGGAGTAHILKLLIL